MKVNYWQKFEEGCYYHIYNRANGDALLFVNDGNFSYFLSKWTDYIYKYVDTIAYCLMGNHFHFIVKIKTVDAEIKHMIKQENTNASQKFEENTISFNAFLEDQFRRLFQSYSLAFNKQQGRHGSLFEPKFKRIELVTIPRIQYAIAYVHHNPLHHDFSPFYETWAYSSYKSYITDKKTKIATDLGLSLFSTKDVSDTLEVSDTSFVEFHKSFHHEWVKNKAWEAWEM
jgi:putative transposase